MANTINLLPDSKQQRLKAQKTRRLIVSISTAVLIVGVAIPIILAVVRSGQTLYLKRTQTQIDDNKSKLKNTENIVTMLTVKDHLNALPQLYQQRLAVSKLLALLPKAMPKEIKLTNMAIDTSGTSISFTGSSNSYTNVEKFQRALEQANTNFDPNKVETNPNPAPYFKSVVLETVGGPSGGQVTFSIKAEFASNIITGGSQ